MRAVAVLVWVWVCLLPVNKAEDMVCVPCDVLFSKVKADSSGVRRHFTDMQLRGEPKSGTGMMHQWASGMLVHACAYLKMQFGEDSCRTDFLREGDQHSGTNRTLLFQPSRGRDAKCPCEDLERAEISVSRYQKHSLPVDEDCNWWHPYGIVPPNKHVACPTYGGRSSENYTDVLGCMTESNCAITDDRDQFVVMRDPRPVAVSSYFHRRNGHVIGSDTTLGEYMPKILPLICTWVTIRYILFSGQLAHRSTIFWYDDAVADPLDFHARFLAAVGLQLPSEVVLNAIDAALHFDFDFGFKHRDRHYESAEEEMAPERSWEEEVGPEVAKDMNETLRRWLPPVLLAKLGVPLVAV